MRWNVDQQLEAIATTLDLLAEKIAKTDKAETFLSKEIPHLIRDKGYTPERAKGAAVSIAREKGLGVAKAQKKSSKK